MDWQYTKDNPLRVFTTFSGYDSQCLAIRDLGIPFDLVGWPKRDITKLRGLGKGTYMILTNILRKHKLQWQMWDSPSHKAFKGIQ